MEELRRVPADDDSRRGPGARPYAISNRSGLSPAMRRALLKVRTAQNRRPGDVAHSVRILRFRTMKVHRARLNTIQITLPKNIFIFPD